MLGTFVQITCINGKPVYSEHINWSQGRSVKTGFTEHSARVHAQKPMKPSSCICFSKVDHKHISDLIIIINFLQKLFPSQQAKWYMYLFLARVTMERT